MWSQRLTETVNDPADLPAAIAALLEQQRATWPALCEGEAALGATPSKTLARGDGGLLAQANLRRSTSTFARTDAATIAARPCFLCESNLPPEERGVGFDDLVIMPNPFPAVPEHLTLAAREHVPQRIAGRINTMLRVAWAMGEEYFVLYNGPRCGASAPDHFHFQAGRRALMPIFAHSLIDTGHGLQVLTAGERNAFLARAAEAEEAATQVEDCLARISRHQPEQPEPMINVLATFQNGHFVVLVFPRTRHRPGDFFSSKDALAISPAALEMAGLVVVCDEAQFNRLELDQVEAIFREVCVSAPVLREALT